MSTADLFDLVWNDLADLMGTAAVAALMKRALRQASLETPALRSLSIAKEDLEYRYDLPDSWQENCKGETGRSLHDLLAALGPLLVQLTGPVVVRRLQRLAPLRICNVLLPDEVSAWLSR